MLNMMNNRCYYYLINDLTPLLLMNTLCNSWKILSTGLVNYSCNYSHTDNTLWFVFLDYMIFMIPINQLTNLSTNHPTNEVMDPAWHWLYVSNKGINLIICIKLWLTHFFFPNIGGQLAVENSKITLPHPPNRYIFQAVDFLMVLSTYPVVYGVC